jgi:CBS domain-containing protein
MVSRPDVHPPSITIGELRAFFEDDHVHIALLVKSGKLLGAVDRTDLAAAAASDETPALALSTIAGRTVDPNTPLPHAEAAMRRSGQRRLAVTTDDSRLVGLLCLKANSLGFCSDHDVSSRKRGVPKPQASPGRLCRWSA